MIVRLLSTCGALLALALAGCASNQRAPLPPPSRPAPHLPAPTTDRAPSSRAYVDAAAAIDLFEIRSGEIALRRSGRDRNRQFARAMIDSHRGLSAQLSLAGRRLNLLPSRVLPPRYRALLAELETSNSFDTLYVRQQVTVHQDALRLHASYASRGDSATLRPVAKAAIPVIRAHLGMLSRL